MKRIMMLLYIFLSVFCFAQELPNVPSNDFYSGINFTNIRFLPGNKIVLEALEPVRFKKTGTFTIDISMGIPFINVVWEDNKRERLLVISNKSICNVFDAAKPLVLMGNDRVGAPQEIWLTPFTDIITASSYLVEGAISYAPVEGLFPSVRKGRPLFQPLWVEGAPGHGIYEKLFITARACFALHISIGYVSFVNPELYHENSRPKRIRLAVNNTFSFDVDLEDTPNYQTITLPRPLKANEVLQLEILDVYPGTKYTDTCINDIMYDYVPWRPEK